MRDSKTGLPWQGAWFDGGMDAATAEPLDTRLVWATAACFVLGAVAGTLLLWGVARPLAGAGSVGALAAAVAGLIAAGAFGISTGLNRRGEKRRMPRWQNVISALSAVALTIAFAAVTMLGVLLVGEILSVGLQGLELPALGGGLLTGLAAGVGGRFAFRAGASLQTADLAELLFTFLVIGTLFAMLTAANPRWWELNFSQLGSGEGSWAFNGTLLIAGLLVATIGAYLGRDLHRILGDALLGRIAWIVVLWAATGVALAAVGLFPLQNGKTAHNIAALGTLVLFIAAAVLTTAVMPGPPRALLIVTVGVVLLVIVAVVLADPLRLYPVTALEAIVVGLGLLWMTTLVRTIAVLAPPRPRVSGRTALLRH